MRDRHIQVDIFISDCIKSIQQIDPKKLWCGRFCRATGIVLILFREVALVLHSSEVV